MNTTSSTTAKNPNNLETPSITPLRHCSCKNLAGSATLHYELGTADNGELYWRISRNAGAGLFNDDWIAFAAIRKALEAGPQDKPITSMTLARLFTGMSINTPSFVLATLRHSGIVEVQPGKHRHYTLGDIDGFLKNLDTDASHSDSSEAPGKAKAKPRRRMRKTAKVSS